MAERTNGKGSFSRRTHGSERRGVFPVPTLNYAARQEQSQRDRARLRQILSKQKELIAEDSGRFDLGNKELPAYRHKQEIIASVNTYKAVILGGETGSGKSTQLPQYLFEEGYDMTIVLVPRRVIADGLTDRIREEMSESLGEVEAHQAVGVTHGERVERHENNKILVMTPNTFNLMEKDVRAQYGDKKVAIVADEIHEANLFTEVATGIAALAVRDHEKWRLVAASATHNAESLQSSFQELNGGYVPSIHIEGRPFDIERSEEPELNTMEVYARKGEEHEKAMIFTSGKKEIDHIIDETIKELDRLNTGSSSKVIFRKLHSELSEFELSHINDPIPEGHRMVIVSSPAGMSGITIPGVTMVITDGTINRQELDDDGTLGLLRHYLSKAEITQQMGRSGRDVGGGIGILAKPTTVGDDQLRARGKQVDMPQMEFKPFDERAEHAPPEIYSSNLSRVVLSVAAIDQRFSDINPYIPHKVEASAIISAEESLSRLGALDDEDKITDIGRIMNKLPISPELSRGITEIAEKVRRRDSTLQQLARAALIVSAVDAGGLQDFTDPQQDGWKKFIRPTTTDDFIAQLDLMASVKEYGRSGRPLPDFIDVHGLSHKRVERANKVARKILHENNANLDNIIVTPPLPDEEAELRETLSAGMIDLVHEEVGRSPDRKMRYRNIHGDDDSTKRIISGRSVSKPEKGQLVAGIPRWFVKRKSRTGEEIRFDVVEMTLHVDAETIGKHALANHLLTGKLIDARIDGDIVVELEQPMFGSLKVGNPQKTVWREHIPEVTRNMLTKRALEAPGPAQRALREIADELSAYEQRIPANVLAEYIRPNAPSNVTKTSIEALIREQALYTRSLLEIDQRLAQYVYSKNVTINRYFDDAAREELQRRSPDTIVIGGVESRVFYENGEPYITKTSREQKAHASAPVFLADGREVKLQIVGQGGAKTRVSIGHLEI